MNEHTDSLDVKSLDGKGALWTLAGTGIALAANSLFGGGGGLGGILGGGGNCGGANSALAAELALSKARLSAQEDICAAKQSLSDVLYAMDKRVTLNEANIANIQGVLGQITKVVIPSTAVCTASTTTTTTT